MPSRSEAQRKMIFAKRSKYKTKENTPDKYKFIWDKGYENKGELPEKVEESLFRKYINRIYSEELDHLSPDQFEFYQDTQGTGKRGEYSNFHITFTDGNGEDHDGTIIKEHGNYRVDWDYDGPEEWEGVEEFINSHWELIKNSRRI